MPMWTLPTLGVWMESDHVYTDSDVSDFMERYPTIY